MLAPGQKVRVRLDWPEQRGPCHIRTPHYLRGAQGVVEKHLGAFPLPVEVIAMAAPQVARRFAALGGQATLRPGVITDNAAKPCTPACPMMAW